MMAMLVVRLLVALQWALGFDLKVSVINSYLSIVGCYCTSFMMAMHRVLMVRLLVVLQRVLEFKL